MIGSEKSEAIKVIHNYTLFPIITFIGNSELILSALTAADFDCLSYCVFSQASNSVSELI
jgi:hypothetical protein